MQRCRNHGSRDLCDNLPRRETANRKEASDEQEDKGREGDEETERGSHGTLRCQVANGAW